MQNLANLDIVGTLSGYLIGFLMVVPALTLHEWAHAYAAYKMGDNTARMLGRLSLNPLRHIDPVGTVAIPVVLLIATGGQFSFGYAKPVPINPRNFRDHKKGILITGIAGPVMNMALGLSFALLVRGLTAVVLAMSTTLDMQTYSTVIANTIGILHTFSRMNFALALFNLIPIPPLDGSRVLQRFLSGRVRELYGQFEQYGMLIVAAVVYFTPLLDWTIYPAITWLLHFVSGW